MSREQESIYAHTSYVVSSEPVLFHALRIYGRGHEKVDEVLKGAEPRDHIARIKERTSDPNFVRNERNVALADLAMDILVNYIITQRLDAGISQEGNPVDSLVELGYNNR